MASLNEVVTHARVKFVDDNHIEVLPINKIKQFQNSVPRSRTDFDPEKLYETKWFDHKNPDGVDLKIRIADLACGTDEAKKLNSKRPNFRPLQFDEMHNFQYEASDEDDNYASKEEKDKQKKKSFKYSQKEIEDSIIKSKINALQNSNILNISKAANSVDEKLTSDTSLHDVSYSNSDYDLLKMKCKELELKLMNKEEECYNLQMKYTKLNNRFENVQLLNEKLQEQLISALDNNLQKSGETENHSFYKQGTKNKENTQIYSMTIERPCLKSVQDSSPNKSSHTEPLTTSTPKNSLFSSPVCEINPTFGESPINTTPLRHSSDSADNDDESSFNPKVSRNLNRVFESPSPQGIKMIDSLGDKEDNHVKKSRIGNIISESPEKIVKSKECAEEKLSKSSSSQKRTLDESQEYVEDYCDSLSPIKRKGDKLTKRIKSLPTAAENSKNESSDTDREKTKEFLEKWFKISKEGKKMRMRYLGNGFSVEDEMWLHINSHDTAGKCTKDLLRHFYTSHELCRRCIKNDPSLRTPRENNKRVPISPTKYAVLLSCYKYFVKKKSSSTGMKRMTELKSMNKFITEEINYVIQKMKKNLRNENNDESVA